MFGATFTVLLVGASGALLASAALEYDTIVVGLGSAGTTAASTLARAGRRVLGLEAQGRVGGRVRTERFADGIVELGAEWIHGLHPSRVYDLAVQNNVSVLLQDLPLAVYRSDGSKIDATLTELLNYCFEIMEEASDVPESMGQLIDRKLKQYLAENRPELLDDKKLLDRFLEMMNEVVNTLEASNSFYDVTTQSSYVPLNGSLYGSWHRHGYKTFFEILLNTYNNGSGLPTLDIKLNKEVTSIQWPKDSSGHVTVTCADGAQYSAPNVIVTVSLGVLKERHGKLFTPPLPLEKVAAIESISMGLLDKVVLLFDEPWPVSECMMFYWSAEDLNRLPQEDKWVSKFAGTTPPAGAANTLTLWIAGESAKLEETLSEEVVQGKVMELLQRFAGANVTVPRPLAMLRSTWFSNPFTRGSYTYDNLEMPRRPGLREALAAPLSDAGGVSRVLFAGEATNTAHYSTVHGASDSGFREAQRLLSAGSKRLSADNL